MSRFFFNLKLNVNILLIFCLVLNYVCIFVKQNKQQKLKIMENVKKFGTLNAGTIVNFYRSTTADDTNFVVLDHYENNFGKFTRVLRLDNFELDMFTQHTEITNFWTIVKEN